MKREEIIAAKRAKLEKRLKWASEQAALAEQALADYDAKIYEERRKKAADAELTRTSDEQELSSHAEFVPTENA